MCLMKNCTALIFLLLITALILPGCKTYSYRNIAGDGKDAAPAAESFFWNDIRKQPRPFVGLAISGGGNRAAAFSAAVLEKLDEIGVLEHVSAISSVSGGSVTAAYYSLNAPEREQGKPLPREFWNDFHKALETDFMSVWWWKLYLPHNFMLRFLTDYDRSDVMAEVFDDKLFHGQTFEALKKWNPRLFINATQVVWPERFVFNNFHFNDLHSALKDYPISNAVIASAAFPGLFNNVTLFNFNTNDYWHLYDGGNVDNLGLETLGEVASRYMAELSVGESLRAIDGHEVTGNDADACLIISIDAQTDPNNPKSLQQSDTREGGHVNRC
ncbi:MAG: patatin-like phospholipase family protein, partial [Nitrospira sp.]|nr:patatin-like phospholipase family protein [Nitrospira sp.]